MTPSSETLRKAAIVIASLDEAAADRLLESMPDEVASRIRWMSVELENVSEEERRAVLDEFLRNSGRTIPQDEPGVELDFTYAAEPSSPKPVAAAPTPPPFAFLNDAPGEMLSSFFEQEHPQVTAVVMSYLKPDRASDILRHLPAALQADIVHRITQLDEPSQEIVADIEARIRQIVSRQTLSFQRRRMGLAAAQAILKAVSGQQAETLRAELRTRGLELPESPVADPPSEANPEFSFLPPSPVVSHINQHETPPPQPAKPQQTPEPAPAPKTPEKATEIQPAAKAASAAKRPVPTPEPLADPQPKFPFERFAALDDAALAKVLHQAGPKVVLLALCGASPAVMKRISRGLGGTDVKRLEAKIRQMQPVLLADIDRAKREMCLAADALLSHAASSSSSRWQAAA